MTDLYTLTKPTWEKVKQLIKGSSVIRKPGFTTSLARETGIVECTGGGSSGSGSGGLYRCQRRFLDATGWENYGTSYLIDANDEELVEGRNYLASVLGYYDNLPVWVTTCCEAEDFSSSSSTSQSQNGSTVGAECCSGTVPTSLTLTVSSPDPCVPEASYSIDYSAGFWQGSIQFGEEGSLDLSMNCNNELWTISVGGGDGCAEFSAEAEEGMTCDPFNAVFSVIVNLTGGEGCLCPFLTTITITVTA